ncbi:NADH dehydrogenase subunit J [Ekhidna lutea]|uniref:NADH-quinone oxidoreductase subunit J n=1 Tax=Ekhidna lutea TaxID=447679 RepID=A0A239HLT7_EKHLU|nr:NADH-quinone oxidoreductase subunit J [Ekhidna lutea]SNS82272.1 NADH dehydrogenase subunit J [Ekhidna lutea]
MIITVQIFLLMMVLAGVGIILFTRNIVHAAYALCLTLLGIAGVYVLVMSELLAVVQIMLYAGGVVILLAFGVMMTNRLRGEKVLSGSNNKWIGRIISVGVFAGLCYLISISPFQTTSVEKNEDQIAQIGVSFLTDHIVAFELIAFVLLVALVGAAYLAKNAADE